LRHPSICTSVGEPVPLSAADDAVLDPVIVATNRFRVASVCGTMTSWHEPVARIVANMCRMQACRSALIIAGKTSAASTSAFSDVLTSRIASSVI